MIPHGAADSNGPRAAKPEGRDPGGGKPLRRLEQQRLHRIARLLGQRMAVATDGERRPLASQEIGHDLRGHGMGGNSFAAGWVRKRAGIEPH